MANGKCDRCGADAIHLYEDSVPNDQNGVTVEKICDACTHLVEQTVEGTLPPGSPANPIPGQFAGSAIANPRRAPKVKLFLGVVKRHEEIEQGLDELEGKTNEFLAGLDTDDVDVDIQYQAMQGVEAPGLDGGITGVNAAGQQAMRPVMIFTFVIRVTWR